MQRNSRKSTSLCIRYASIPAVTAKSGIRLDSPCGSILYTRRTGLKITCVYSVIEYRTYGGAFWILLEDREKAVTKTAEITIILTLALTPVLTPVPALRISFWRFSQRPESVRQRADVRG